MALSEKVSKAGYTHGEEMVHLDVSSKQGRVQPQTEWRPYPTQRVVNRHKKGSLDDVSIPDSGIGTDSCSIRSIDSRSLSSSITSLKVTDDQPLEVKENPYKRGQSSEGKWLIVFNATILVLLIVVVTIMHQRYGHLFAEKSPIQSKPTTPNKTGPEFVPRDCTLRPWKVPSVTESEERTRLRKFCSSLTSTELSRAKLARRIEMREFDDMAAVIFAESYLTPRSRNKRDAVTPYQPYRLPSSTKPVEVTSTAEPETKGSSCDDFPLHCDPTVVYRSFSGHCNNLRNPDFGRHSVPLTRLLPPSYDDGVLALKTRNLGRRLPNPRIVSAIVHDDVSRSDERHTLALMQWGQFLAHDVAMTPKFTGSNNLKLNCDECFKDVGGETGPCAPIPIPFEDSYFPALNRTTGLPKCIPFTRSLPVNIHRGHREQMNNLSAYIDSSTVYGSDECKISDLREFRGGKLRVVDHPLSPKIFKPLMPRTTINQECKSPTGKCFFAGEERNSEQPGLTSFHTLFMREHNRLANQLSLENPHWADEHIFQEARKILIGINQHVTLNEFLPRVLGPYLVQKFGLVTGNHTYDDKCSADITNEFATAAFRFGHSLIRPDFTLMKNREEKFGNVSLKNHFFNPDVLFRAQVVDRLMRGVLSTPMERFDSHMSKGLTNHLFETKGMPFSGMDLAAINIQRGRDHGLRGYVEYLKLATELCFPEDVVFVSNMQTFDDLAQFIGLNAAHKLSKVYRDILDIDLFTGGLSEPSLDGGVVGKTFGCLIAKQFDRLKRCDRFWYEDPKLGFKDEKLEEIQKLTLSSLLCRNWDAPGAVQRHAFDLPSEDNPIQDCSNLPQIDTSFWRESFGRSFTGKRFCDVQGRVIPMNDELRIGACTVCSCGLGATTCRTVVESCSKLEADFGIAGIMADDACKDVCPDAFSKYKDVSEVPVNI